MEREAWLAMVARVRRVVPTTAGKRFTFSWDTIVLTYLWAVVHNQPISWACRVDSWPQAVCPARLPTPSTMTRRLQRPRALGLFKRLLGNLHRGQRRMLLSYVDGKVLPVQTHSRDGEARFGGRYGRSRGYKLHLILGENDRIEDFEVLPLNVNERGVARQMTARTRLQGYLLGDAQYDDNRLYAECAARGVQLVTPRQYGPDRNLGHIRHAPARLRAVALLEQPPNDFGRNLYRQRRAIERFFGQLASAPYGLSALPTWVRSLERVRRWVTAKLLVFCFMRRYRKHAA